MKLPYGKSFLELETNEKMYIAESRISELKGSKSGRELVCEALDHPIGSLPLSKLAVGKKTCVIIISDHTRPVPSRDILPEMIADLRKGNPDIQISLLVATGFHRLTTPDELREKLGESIMNEVRIVIHDSRNAAQNVKCGILPSGAELIIDKEAAEADLLVAEGFIEPHFFAGFSGGRKSVLPGICSETTVLGNHCGAFIASPCARTGVLDGNPIHKDMAAAAKLAGLAFIVNVVINENKQTVAAFAGNYMDAHKAGCEYLRGYAEVAAPLSDIVITTNGGAPLDQNIYQCVKSMTAAETVCRDGGVIIVAAECADGTGGDGFYRSLKNAESAAALYQEFSNTPQDKTVPDQWESQILARVLKDHTVIFVTRPELKETVEDMKMVFAGNIEDALRIARGELGRSASVTVIPNGISVIMKRIS